MLVMKTLKHEWRIVQYVLISPPPSVVWPPSLVWAIDLALAMVFVLWYIISCASMVSWYADCADLANSKRKVLSTWWVSKSVMVSSVLRAQP